MSSLIFYTDKEQALVATDTLAVEADGQPLLFTSKSSYIPHLKTIICGTGCGGFSNEWASYVNNRMILQGILNLDYHTPEKLNELWDKYKVEYNLPEGFTTTVYHIGFSEETDEIVTFVYRSTNNFESEQLPFGTAVKPGCKVLDGNLFENLQTMMEEQRTIQDSLPDNERIYIGGEIYCMYLTRAGCNISKAGEFPEFKEQQKFVLTKCSSS